MKALALAGRIILENGGETYRAEDTVLRMAQALGLAEADVFAVPSGLFISFTDEAGERRASVNRVHLQGTHLERVDRVNQISRRLAEGDLSPETLIDELKTAGRLGDQLAWWFAPVSACLSAMGFAVMFGGGLVDIVIGGLCAALTQLVPFLFRRDDSSGMAAMLAGGILCAFIPLCFHALTGLGVPDAIIASALMPLVPGLSMTNAVQDILRGDMVSGVTHCARAVMIAAMVAGGTLVGTHLADALGLMAQSSIAPSTLPFTVQLLLAFGSSFVSGLGFGALLAAPRKAILWSGFLGAVGYVAYWLCMQGAMAETAAMFIGALLASIGTQIAARRFKMIATVFVTIAILPMVPGLGLYRAMSALAQGALASGGAIAAHTMALIIMIALGIALGSALTGVRKRKDSKA